MAPCGRNRPSNGWPSAWRLILIVAPATAGVALATYLFMPLPASLPQEKPQADSQVRDVYAVDGTAIGEFREAATRRSSPPTRSPR